MPVQAGTKYGKLTALYVCGKSKNRNNIWRCKCECGETIDVSSSSLVSGNTKSCGCLRKESMRAMGLKNRQLNKYDLSGDYGIGYTSNGDEFLFDIEDYEVIKDYTWRANPEGYIVTVAYGKIIRMHMLVMNSDGTKVVDHINHKVNDNRKENLRLCTRCENQAYTKTYTNNTSGRKGVYWDKARQKWMVVITSNKKTLSSGAV